MPSCPQPPRPGGSGRPGGRRSAAGSRFHLGWAGWQAAVAGPDGHSSRRRAGHEGPAAKEAEMSSGRAFASFLVPLVLVIGRPGRLHTQDGSSVRIEKHDPLTTGRDRLLGAGYSGRTVGSPHPCSAYGAARPAQRLVSMALSRRSLTRMRSWWIDRARSQLVVVYVSAAGIRRRSR